MPNAITSLLAMIGGRVHSGCGFSTMIPGYTCVRNVARKTSSSIRQPMWMTGKVHQQCAATMKCGSELPATDGLM